MVWFILALAAVFALFFAGFRKSALSVAVAALVAGVAVYYLEQRQDEQATHRIATSEVTLQNISFRETFRSSYELSGRVTNESKTYSMDGISFAVTLEDCQGGGNEKCAVVGRATASASLRVPPQQTRDFTAPMYFGGDEIKPKGKLVWDFQIASIVAKRP